MNPLKIQSPPFLSDPPDTKPQIVLQTGTFEPILVGPTAGAAASGLPPKKDVEKPETPFTADTSLAPEANEDASNAEEEDMMDEELPTTSSSAACVPEKPFPLMNADIFQAITVAIRKHRLTREGSAKSEEKEVRLVYLIRQLHYGGKHGNPCL